MPQNSFSTLWLGGTVSSRGVDVVGDEQVEVAVAIDVDERAARAPERRTGAAGVGDLGKPTASGIAIQRIRPDVGDVEIGEAVIVEVPRAGAHAVVAVADVRAVRHILEGSVAAVSIQAVTGALGHRRIRVRAAVNEKHVEPAVVVEVEEEAARPHDFREELLVAGPVDVHEIQSGRAGNISKGGRGGWRGRCPLARSCPDPADRQHGDGEFPLRTPAPPEDPRSADTSMVVRGWAAG